MTRPLFPPAVTAALPTCRTFNMDGTGPICNAPARYIVWGHLLEKMDKGPKCYRHLPTNVKNHMPGLGIAPIFDLATFGVSVLNSGDTDPVDVDPPVVADSIWLIGSIYGGETYTEADDECGWWPTLEGAQDACDRRNAPQMDSYQEYLKLLNRSNAAATRSYGKRLGDHEALAAAGRKSTAPRAPRVEPVLTFDVWLRRHTRWEPVEVAKGGVSE